MIKLVRNRGCLNKHIHVVGRVEIMESIKIVIEKMNHVRGVIIETIY